MASNDYSVGQAENLFDLSVMHNGSPFSMLPGAVNIAPYKQTVRVKFRSELDAQTAQMLIAIAGAEAPIEALEGIKAEVIDQTGRVSRTPWFRWLRHASSVSLTPTPPSRRRR